MRPCASIIAMVAFAAAGGGFAADDAPETPRKPTFYATRPKGERQLLAPLPKEHPRPPDIRFGNFRPNNPIDNFILARIQSAGKRPKPVCNDWDFVRRAGLDLVGVIPTAADVEQFFSWDAKIRRARWIDHVLSQQHYADHWTAFWGDLLREQGRIRGAPPDALKRFIHEGLKQNRPYDAWVRDMLTASGPASDNPATAFVLRDQADADTLTVTVTQSFLGVQVKCAQCHDHPFDWWTEKDFAGMAGFWRGTRAKVYRREEIFRNGARTEVPFMEVRSDDRLAEGTFLTGAKSSGGRGREALAELVTRSDNPYFARVAVNRLWTAMMGAGLVNPVDNFTPRNPPSHPELLDWLAVEFIENKYDLKHVLRLIANSRTYQQTSSERPKRRYVRRTAAEGGEPNEGDDNIVAGSLFDGMPLRRMTAEQIHDSILIATGRYLPDNPRFQPSIQVSYPPNPRSFLRVFGCTDRETLLPRNTSSSIQQSLTLLNGDLIHDAIRLHPDHPIRYWQKQRGMSAGQIVEALFVQVLTRPPTDHERALALQYLVGGFRDQLWEDLQWSLLNTREFQFIR